MNRQSSINDIASALGITPQVVSEHIGTGLFLATHDEQASCHWLDRDECEWAWLVYTNYFVTEVDSVNDKTMRQAVDFVKGLRKMIIEEGSYFDGIQQVKQVREHVDYQIPIVVQVLIGAVLFFGVFVLFT